MSITSATCVFVNNTMYNITNGCFTENGTVANTSSKSDRRIIAYLMVAFYVFIFIFGIIGNGLVIYVVLCYAKMKTVTNMYILNLAVSDILFLISLPFLITTTLLKHWIFGFAVCKIYFVLFSINLFTSVFTLLVMSADRYMAVCHAVRSVQYRTPTISLLICLCIWALSFLVMLPIILYSNTVSNPDFNSETCTVEWPKGQPIPADKAFSWYTFILGFAIPVTLISVFYVSVVLKLRTVGPAKKSKEMKKSHKRVTRMVLTVIFVYVSCWLPYWIFQIELTFKSPLMKLPLWKINLFSVFTVLQFANSMLNPFLYAFLSENFRKSFVKAFKCASTSEVNKTLFAENSVFPRPSQGNCTRSMVLATSTAEGYEFTNVNSGLSNKPLDSTFEPSCVVYTESDALKEETAID